MSLRERVFLQERIWSYRSFFPAAALYGAALVPLSVQAMTGQAPWVHALASPLAHARELVFGFTLAIVAGYLMGNAARWRVWGVLGLWLAARAAWLAAPGEMPAMATQAAFAGAVAVMVVPKFLGAGRKLRNLAMGPLIGLLAAGAVAFDTAPAAPWWSQAQVSVSAVLLFAWLLAFMGGRLIAPAAAGQRYRQGENLAARVQPRVEGAIIVALAVAAVLALEPSAWPVAGGFTLAGGILVAVRLARWELWRCRARPDLWCLGAGYGWLAVGLGLLGATLLAGRAPYGALHGITVGAIGTLTWNVMLRTHLQRSGGAAARERLIPIGTTLIAIAAVARLAAQPGIAAREGLLAIAAAAWCVAYLVLACRLLVRPSARA